tara:strand:- start:5748 stop:7688 length:1941 start_codon:yes stop_codon:yes gene_type:complete
MRKLNEALDKFFSDTESLTMKTLFEEVEKVIDLFDLQDLNEAPIGFRIPPRSNKLAQETKANIMSLLPKFEISEAWGQKDTPARAEFEKYMNNITGTLSEKLAYIREFVNQSGERAGEYETSEILSNLMFLDLLSTVVNNFSPSGAGFLFEAFMAGLLKGTQAIEKVEGVLQIEDFLDADDKPFSLKLLVPGTNVKGSTRNLISFLANHEKGAEGIEYLTVYKFGPEGKTKVLSFYSFTIDHENIYYWLSDTFKVENKKIYDIALASGAAGEEGAPARRIGGESPEEVESANAAQREAVAKVRKSYGYRLQKRRPDSFKGQMKSPEGMEGAALLKFHGIKTGILGKGKYGRVFDLTEEEIEKLPVSYDELAAGYGMSKDEYTSYSRTVRRHLHGSNLKGKAARAKAEKLRALEAAAASGENEEEMTRWNAVAKAASEIRALDYTLFDVAQYRKDTYEKIRAIVSPAHPLGTALQPVRFAGDEEAVKGIEKSIEDMKALYDEDRKAWEREMLIKANLIPHAEKAVEEPAFQFEAKKKKVDDDEKEDIKTQFNISSKLIVSRTLPAQYKKVRYGDIKVDRESIVEVGNIYAKELEASVIPILEQLANLIAGITGYFAGDPEGRGQAGTSANDAITALKAHFTEQKIEQ